MPDPSDAKSMRFSLAEVLSGMFATVSTDRFTNDPQRLARSMEDLAERYTLFAPLAQGVDPTALSAALETLADRKFIQRDGTDYLLTAEGRAQCVGSKRTLFNRDDREALEDAARRFDELQEASPSGG